MRNMITHAEVLGSVKNLAALAQDCEVRPAVVYSWQRRCHVPSAYWNAVSRHMQALGIQVTPLDLLAADLLQHRLKLACKRAATGAVIATAN
jgi:hypothetical protein